MDERTWVERHRHALLGASRAQAEARVRVAGFEPIVHEPDADGSLTITASYLIGGVGLVIVSDLVTGVTPG